MQKIRNFIKYYWHLLLLLIISLVSHWYIFFDSKILNAGDWIYIPQELLKKLIFYGQWTPHSNLGEVIALSPNMVFYWFASILANISPFFSWDIFTRLFFLIPIVFLTPLFSFLLFKKIFKNNLIAFFSACIYSFNTFFLKLQLDDLSYTFIWWVLPALFLSILNYLETKKNKHLIYNALIVFLGIVYELRIMILVLVFLSFFQIIYLFFKNESLKERIKNSLYVLGSVSLGILGHAFWLIPLKFGNIFGEVMSKASASPFASFYDILDTFTLHMYSWSHNLVLEPFIKQPIEFRHFLIPLFTIIGIISFRKLFKEKGDAPYFIFFAISLIFFIFLGKQAFEPFKNFYSWAFYNVPLFNLYRESSKFFILIALSLSFFFGLGLFYIYQLIKSRYKKLAIFIAILILFFSSISNLQHFVDQKIGGMAKGITINNDYLKLEKKLSSDSNFYRILWMPTKPRFGFYSEQHPFINAVDLTNILKDQISFTLFDKSLPVYSQLLFLLQQNYSDQLLDNMDVKYVLVPVAETRIKKISITETQTVNAIYENYGEKESFINGLDKVPYLKKIDIGIKDLVVYENENYKPHIYSDTGINYYQTNASEFGDFSQNQNLYLNSDIKKNDYLLSRLDNIIVPIEADPDKIVKMQLAVDNTTDPLDKKKLQGDLDSYTTNTFLKDFKLKIPAKAAYKIYIKSRSPLLANNKNIGIQIDNIALQKNAQEAGRQGWNYFNQIELGIGEHSFKVYIGDEVTNFLNSGDIVLSTENLTAPIKTPQLEYKQINPTKYIINVHGASESFPLIFSESFHPGWKIYIQPELTEQGSEKFVSDNNQGTVQNENLADGNFYDLLSKKPILDDKHFMVSSFANAWWVDPSQVCKSGCIKNPDGSYDFSVSIEFEPQKYFYIGLVISGVTLLGCLGYLVYDWRKRKFTRIP